MGVCSRRFCVYFGILAPNLFTIKTKFVKITGKGPAFSKQVHGDTGLRRARNYLLAWVLAYSQVFGTTFVCMYVPEIFCLIRRAYLRCMHTKLAASMSAVFKNINLQFEYTSVTLSNVDLVFGYKLTTSKIHVAYILFAGNY